MRRIGRALFGLALGFVSLPAQAQTGSEIPNAASEAFGECLAMQTTGADRLLVARWVGTSIAASPQLSSIMTLNAGEKERTDRAMAALFVRLFASTCAEEARPLLEANDNAGVEAAFSVLGQLAMRELMSNSGATRALQAFAQYISPEAFEALTQE